MPKILTVGTEEFEFPLEGENAGYGEQVTDWAEAVTDALTTVQQPNDILTQSAAINNNQTSAANIPAFSFDTSEVVAINAEYIIKRTTVSPVNNLVESGVIKGNFNGTSWSITIESVGDSEVELSITSAGQVQYTSSNISGSSYEGQISFKAKVFNEA